MRIFKFLKHRMKVSLIYSRKKDKDLGKSENRLVREKSQKCNDVKLFDNIEPLELFNKELEEKIERYMKNVDEMIERHMRDTENP